MQSRQAVTVSSFFMNREKVTSSKNNCIIDTPSTNSFIIEKGERMRKGVLG